MAIYCPRCTYDNPAQSSFCIRCGTTLPGNNAYSAPPMPGQVSFGAGSPGPGAQNQQQAFAVPAASAPLAVPASPAQGLGSFRRAFAGHGTLIKHHSWLLNGQQSNAPAIRQAIMDKIRQRNLDNLNLNQENLTDQSVVEERRDYIKVKRKVTTVFIYVARAGHDLYISRATTVLSAFSLLRTIVLGLILLGIFLPFFNIMATASAISGSVAGSVPVGSGGPVSPAGPSSIVAAGVGLFLWVVVILFLSLPLLWVLFLALGRSITSFILDKDPWVLLRSNRLTEFQMDDVALLEHETDDIVRAALKELGMDADKIVAPSDGYQAKSRFRLI